MPTLLTPRAHLSRSLFLLAMSCLVALPAAADHRRLTLEAESTEVSFTLPATGHDVAGTLGAVNGAIDVDRETGAATGIVTVDLLAAATGNRSRDRTMREEVLETARFAVATFSAEQLVGTLPDRGEADVVLRGTLELHGGKHAVELPAHLVIEGQRLRLATELKVPFKAWGLHDPSLLFLRVGDVVEVRIQGAGALLPGGESNPPPFPSTTTSGSGR